jgi:hypothetical protein
MRSWRAGRARRIRLDVFPEMLHSFQMMAGCAPEADEATARLAAWVRPRLGLGDAGRRREAGVA